MRGTRFSRPAGLLLAASLIVGLIPACSSGDGGGGPTSSNGTPSALNVSVEGMKNTPISVTVRGTDLESTSLTFALASAPTNGTLSAFVSVDGTTATIAYTPNPGFSGTDTFTYTVSDGSNTSSPGTVTITIANKVPTTESGVVEGVEGQDLVITLTGEDDDDDPLTFAITSPPTSGQLGPITTGPPPGTEAGSNAEVTASVTYTPGAGFVGTDAFQFTVSDGTDTSTPGTVDIVVLSEAPTATAVMVQTPKNTAVTVNLTGDDPNGDPLTFAIAANPANGVLGPVNQTGPTTATVLYTPNNAFTGMDGFTYTVNDGDDTSAPATVDIDVENQLPVANAGPDQAGIMKGQVVTLDGTGSQDPDGDPLTFSWVLNDPAASDRSGLLDDPTAAQPTFTPDLAGVWTATVTVSDGSQTITVPDQVAITVVNKVPTAASSNVTAAADAPTVIPLSGTDEDDDPLTFEIVTQPSNGTLGPIQTGPAPSAEAGGTATVNATVTYTPGPGYEGPDQFTYTVTDGTDTSPPATVDITVSAGPQAQPVQVQTVEDGMIHIELNGVDPFGAGLTFAIADGPDNGTLSTIFALDATTAFVSYAPDPGFQGDDSFSFTVTDGNASASAVSPAGSVSIEVLPPVPAAVFLLIPSEDLVIVYNSVTLEHSFIPVGDEPSKLVISPDEQFVYVLNDGDKSVSVLSAATGGVVATVPIGLLPIDLAVHPSGKFVYVLDGFFGTITVIDTRTNTVLRTIGLPLTFTQSVSFNRSGTRAYLADALGKIVVLDTQADVVATSSAPLSPARLGAGGDMDPPDIVAEFDTPGSPMSLFVVGNFGDGTLLDDDFGFGANDLDGYLLVGRAIGNGLTTIYNPDDGTPRGSLPAPDGVSNSLGNAVSVDGVAFHQNFGDEGTYGFYPRRYTQPVPFVRTVTHPCTVSGAGALFGGRPLIGDFDGNGSDDTFTLFGVCQDPIGVFQTAPGFVPGLPPPIRTLAEIAPDAPFDLSTSVIGFVGVADWVNSWSAARR